MISRENCVLVNFNGGEMWCRDFLPALGAGRVGGTEDVLIYDFSVKIVAHFFSVV
jgi:hypothetical protein